MNGRSAVGSGPAAPELPADLPSGLLELVSNWWRRAETWSDRAGLAPPDLDPEALRRRLIDELTAPLRLEHWPAPKPPRPVAGGWLHDEVIDDDRDAFEGLLASRRRDGAEQLAAAAQELRFPATPYRRLPAPGGATPGGGPDEAGGPDIDPGLRAAGAGPLRVVDLTSHWAGPLATSLLAEAGAEVTKIDPDCRPDGFRPRPRLYAHLNRAKEIVDLDLRRDDDRRRFEHLVGRADLLVESFSRRVLPNLGYGPEELRHLNPHLGVVSIKSFPAGGPEADWLAYGPGVHATSGLGHREASPRPAPVAYPDLVAGVAAFARATALAAGWRPNTDEPGVEISLAASIAPLVHRAVAASAADHTPAPRPAPTPAPRPRPAPASGAERMAEGDRV